MNHALSYLRSGHRLAKESLKPGGSQDSSLQEAMRAKASMFVRFEDREQARSRNSELDHSTEDGEFLKIVRTQILDPRAVFMQDLDPRGAMQVLDPRGAFMQKWNQIFVFSCIIAVSIDPLFFYILVIDDKNKCLGLHRSLEIIVCALRTFIDIFYLLRIILQFRTGFVAPSSRDFGRVMLVIYPVAIARRYLSSHFIIDVLSVLPIPQVVVLYVIPFAKRHDPLIIKESLKIIVLVQYVPRLVRIYPLIKEMRKNPGILIDTAWVGAAFNLFLYMLASHVVGAFWYLFSIEQVHKCWRQEFNRQNLSCQYMYCGVNRTNDQVIANLDLVQMLNRACPFVDPDEIKNSTTPSFGIYADALISGVVQSLDFPFKFFYCFWWGLSNLSSLGQNLKPGTSVGEIVFEIFISISGLILFALLIGNMQEYLQSISVRIEEMRVKRERIRKYEKWMAHRMLRDDLRERVRRFEQYKWQETRGVEEENLIRNLPKDLRRDINRDLFFPILLRVPLFANIDEQFLDALCDRLKPVLFTEESFIIQEGYPVDEMLFITRGTSVLDVSTNTGRAGVHSSLYLEAGDFVGEELLTWALEPNSGSNLPISFSTVKAKTEVEAFALISDDLKFVASQFRRFHGEQLRHTFRFYSRQWRTWAACFIQVAWRKYWKRKLNESLHEGEDGGSSSLKTMLHTSSSAVTRDTMPGFHRILPAWKPNEPDFTHNS